MQARQLTRSETNKRIAGVCGGIGEYFGIDPVLVRVGFVVAGLMGWGVLLYVVLWIVLPKGQPYPGAAPAPGGRSPSAIRIAEERFARGEITAEELHQIRGDLTGGS
jgi:phage shock protein PspC (stress-responsive transcriptional regulator)